MMTRVRTNNIFTHIMTILNGNIFSLHFYKYFCLTAVVFQNVTRSHSYKRGRYLLLETWETESLKNLFRFFFLHFYLN